MRITLLAAISEGGVIGLRGALPWHLSADLRRFKRLTMGHVIIMGRKTFESIGRPLPGRTSVVLSRSAAYQPDGATVYASLDEALERSSTEQEVFIVGGADVYRQALPRCNRLLITRVHAALEGDTFFPEYDADQWQLVESQRHEADEKNAHPYTFEVYERVGESH